MILRVIFVYADMRRKKFYFIDFIFLTTLLIDVFEKNEVILLIKDIIFKISIESILGISISFTIAVEVRLIIYNM